MCAFVVSYEGEEMKNLKLKFNEWEPWTSIYAMYFQGWELEQEIESTHEMEQKGFRISLRRIPYRKVQKTMRARGKTAWLGLI